ncbi:MAG: lysostaphin resistance A-like protein [Thermoguttaceae bacterium]
MAALGLGWLLNSVPTIRWDPQAALWGLLATVPLAGLLLVCVHTPLRVFQDLVRLIDRWVVPLFARWNLTQIAILSLLAGLGEEMLFRGVIQNALQARIGPPFGTWVGWLLSSFLFGAAHAVSATYAILATLIGLYLGRLWIETGNLLVPVVAHAAYDFLALVYLVRVRRRA